MEFFLFAGAVIFFGTLVALTKTPEQLAETETTRQAVLAFLVERAGARRTYENAVVIEDLHGRRVRVFAETGIAQKNPWEEWIVVVEGEMGATEPFLLDPLGPIPVQITPDHVAGHAVDDGLSRALHDGAVRAALEDAIACAPLLSVRGKKGGPIVVVIRANGTTPDGMRTATDALARLAVALTAARPRLTTAVKTADGATTSPSGSPIPVPKNDR